MKRIGKLNDRSNRVLQRCCKFLLHCTQSTQNFYYVIEVTTPQFLSTLMKESKSEFVLPHHPYIIVSKLTDENIRTAIQAFIDAKDDLYWLKLYHISATLNIEDINEIFYRKKQDAVKAKINTEIDAESDINH
jgi:hypothetical protein